MSPRGITPPHTSGPTAGASAPPIRRASMPAQPWHGFFRGLAAGLAGLLRRQDAAPAAPLAAWERAAITRRRVFLALIALSTTIATALMAQVQPPYQHPALQYGQIVLFALLFAWVSAGFFTAVMGFYVMLRGDRHALSRQDVRHDPIRPDARTAIIMPICNEHVSTVFAGLRATCESLANSGAQQLFDVYVLSDTSDPDIRSAEIKAWGELRETLGDNARIYYRWRQRRTKRKAGNVADFCRRWGRNYRYMVVLDADSVMSGDCLVNLVRLMEANPKAGIIQTAPQAVGHATIHARSQQFASRVTGRLFTLGMAYWQLGESHYWGHNAIIRVEPFMKHCGLAPLPGRGALSGEIMSHDFVEAALMRRAGYHVWLATDLTGSYEQQPPNLLEELQRDRRWCQGNLQNARLIAEPGLHAVHRAMPATGALAYASAPLWLAFVVLGVALWLTGGLGASVTAFGLPIAVGVGMSIKAQKLDRVAVVFFGDGASNEGAFHEALNMASIWKLPILFVCENNKYGMSMDVSRAMAVPNVADRAVAYAMPGIVVDGNDLPAVAAVAREAAERARSGGGPTLIECKTYRLRGHSKSDRNLYRTKEEIEEWRNRCPIRRLEAELVAHGRFTPEELMTIEEAAQAEIDAALEFAKASPDPDPKDLTRDVYAD